MKDLDIKSSISLISKYSIIVSLTFLAYGWIYFYFFHATKIGACSAFIGILCLLTPMIKRASQSLPLAINYLSFLSISIIIFTSIYTGGTMSPVIFWITTVPLAGNFLSTRNSSNPLRWFIFSLICFALVLGHNHIFGVLPIEVSNTYMPVVTYFALFGILLLNVAFSFLFKKEILAENLKVELKNKDLLEKTNRLASALKELESTQTSLIQSSKLASIGILSAGIAHEINNGLNKVSVGMKTVGNFLEKTSNQEDKQEVEEIFDAMKRGINLCVEIIENLKSYSRKENGKIGTFNLYEIFKSILIIYRSKIGSKIKIIFNFPESFSVQCNHTGMTQLISNLLSNAIDAIDNKEGKIEISTEIGEDSWTLKVSDTGQGISKENIQKIYDPFFTTKEVGKGTGLGLWVVLTETERHRGTIKVESELGIGTTFTLKFMK